jgi:hypothetical protein
MSCFCNDSNIIFLALYLLVGFKSCTLRHVQRVYYFRDRGADYDTGYYVVLQKKTMGETIVKKTATDYTSE